MEKANTPAEITTPDAKLAAFFATLFGSTFLGDPVALLPNSGYAPDRVPRDRVMPPSAHVSELFGEDRRLGSSRCAAQSLYVLLIS